MAGSRQYSCVQAEPVEALRELVARDRELEESASSLRLFDAAVAEIRERAEAIAAFFVRHAEQDERLRETEAHAAAALQKRRFEVDEARAQIDQARSDGERVLAEKQLARADDHIALAERALEQALGERASFDELAEQLTRELPTLGERARTLGATDNDLIEWASTKHAELFVALGQLDTQRERVIREANELATALLGEPTFGSTPAQVLSRIERYWTSSPGHVSESR
jgi:chromosome segregation ATPase